MEGLHLAVDAVGAKHSGAAVVLQGVLSAISDHPGIAQTTVFTSPRSLRQFELPAHNSIRYLDRPDAERGAFSRLLWQERGLQAALKACRCNSVLLLSGGGMPPAGVRGFSFVQQSLPFIDDALQQLGLLDRIRFAVVRATMRRSCHSAVSVIVQTDTMKQALCSSFHIPAARIAVLQAPTPVLPKGTTVPSDPMSAVPFDRRLLYVGNTSVYKNLGILVDAVELVRRQLPDVVLFGTWSPEHPLCRRPGVIGIGTLKREELGAFYRSATLFLMPSLAETVCLPLLEALSVAGCIVAADRDYAVEACGDAAEFVDASSAIAFADAICGLLSNEGRRRHLSARAIQRHNERSLRHPSYQALIDHIVVESRRQK